MLGHHFQDLGGLLGRERRVLAKQLRGVAQRDFDGAELLWLAAQVSDPSSVAESTPSGWG